MKKKYLLFLYIALIACTSEEVFQTDHPTKEIEENIETTLTQSFEKGFVRIQVTENLSTSMEEAVRIGERRTKAMAADDVVSEIKVRSVDRKSVV